MRSRIVFAVIEILLAAAAAMFVYTAAMDSFNIGSICGLSWCMILLLICICRRKIAQILSKLWHGRGRIFLIAAALLLTVQVSATVFFSVRMIQSADRPTDEELPVIVLGCTVKDDRPSVMLSARIDTAYAYLTAHPSAICFATGGKGSDGSRSEARCIYDDLVSRGIAPERIITEKRAVSTETNFAYTAQIMDSMGLPRRAVVVTSEFHQYRSRSIAEGMGFETYAVSAPSPILYLPAWWIREIIVIEYRYLTALGK